MNTMDEELKDLQPAEWSDDVRMAALFGKYRPDHFDFWYPLIYETSKRLNTFTFSMKDLKKRFKRKGLVPIGFAKLFEEAREKQKFVLSSDYNQENNTNVLGAVWRKFVKVAGSYSPLRKGTLEDDTTFVLLPLVQERAAELFEWQAAHEELSEVFLWSELQQWDTTVSAPGLELLVATLHARHLAVTFDVNGVRAVKFARDPHSAQCPSVSSVDRGLVALKHTLHLLSVQLTRVELELLASDAEVTKSLAARNRKQALMHLKRKKVLQALHDKRLSAKHNIEQVLITVHSAQSDQAILAAYKSGVAGLQHVQQQHSVDEIEDTLEDWRESVASQDELSQALTGVTDQLVAVDDAELEREYEALESEQRKGLEVTPVTPVTVTSVKEGEDDELIAALKQLTVKTSVPQSVRTADLAM